MSALLRTHRHPSLYLPAWLLAALVGGLLFLSVAERPRARCEATFNPDIASGYSVQCWDHAPPNGDWWGTCDDPLGCNDGDWQGPPTPIYTLCSEGWRCFQDDVIDEAACALVEGEFFDNRCCVPGWRTDCRFNHVWYPDDCVEGEHYWRTCGGDPCETPYDQVTEAACCFVYTEDEWRELQIAEGEDPNELDLLIAEANEGCWTACWPHKIKKTHSPTDCELSTAMTCGDGLGVHIGIGESWINRTDFQVPGMAPGLTLAMGRMYRSQSYEAYDPDILFNVGNYLPDEFRVATGSEAFGPGWYFPWEMELIDGSLTEGADVGRHQALLLKDGRGRMRKYYQRKNTADRFACTFLDEDCWKWEWSNGSSNDVFTLEDPSRAGFLLMLQDGSRMHFEAVDTRGELSLDAVGCDPQFLGEPWDDPQCLGLYNADFHARLIRVEDAWGNGFTLHYDDPEPIPDPRPTPQECHDAVDVPCYYCLDGECDECTSAAVVEYDRLRRDCLFLDHEESCDAWQAHPCFPCPHRNPPCGDCTDEQLEAAQAAQQACDDATDAIALQHALGETPNQGKLRTITDDAGRVVLSLEWDRIPNYYKDCFGDCFFDRVVQACRQDGACWTYEYNESPLRQPDPYWWQQNALETRDPDRTGPPGTLSAVRSPAVALGPGQGEQVLSEEYTYDTDGWWPPLLQTVTDAAGKTVVDIDYFGADVELTDEQWEAPECVNLPGYLPKRVARVAHGEAPPEGQQGPDERRLVHYSYETISSQARTDYAQYVSGLLQQHGFDDYDGTGTGWDPNKVTLPVLRAIENDHGRVTVQDVAMGGQALRTARLTGWSDPSDWVWTDSNWPGEHAPKTRANDPDAYESFTQHERNDLRSMTISPSGRVQLTSSTWADPRVANNDTFDLGNCFNQRYRGSLRRTIDIPADVTVPCPRYRDDPPGCPIESDPLAEPCTTLPFFRVTDNEYDFDSVRVLGWDTETGPFRRPICTEAFGGLVHSEERLGVQLGLLSLADNLPWGVDGLRVDNQWNRNRLTRAREGTWLSNDMHLQDDVQDALGRPWTSQGGRVRLEDGTSHRRIDETKYHVAGHQQGWPSLQVVDMGGLELTTSFEYDPIGNVTVSTNPRGHRTERDYNALGWLLEERTPLVTLKNGTRVQYRTRYFHDRNGNVVRQEVENLDHEGNARSPAWIVTRWEHDSRNRPTKMVQFVDGRDVVTEYVHDAHDNQVETITPEAVAGRQPTARVQHVFDERGFVFQTIEAPGNADQVTTQHDYDVSGNIARIVVGLEAAEPQVTLREYDGYDRLVRETLPTGTQREITRWYEEGPYRELVTDTVRGQRDRNGSGTALLSETVTEIDVLGRETTRWERSFDITTGEPSEGQPECVRSIANHHGPDGWHAQKLESIDHYGNTTQIYFDRAGRQSRVVDELGNEALTRYDENGNVVLQEQSDHSQVDGRVETHALTRAYDELNRLIQEEIHPRDGGDAAQGLVTDHEYDSLGRLARSTDPLGGRIVHVHDDLGRPRFTERQPRPGQLDEAITTEQRWDDNGRLVMQVDDNGNETTYHHDALGRRWMTVFADETVMEIEHDVFGNERVVTHPNGTIVTTTFDAGNNVDSKSIAVGPGVSSDTTWESYEHDGLGRLVFARDADSLIHRRYDSLGHAVFETQNGWELRRSFDAAGNVVDVEAPEWHVTREPEETARGPIPRLKRVLEGDANLVAEYSYVGATRVEQVHLGSGATSLLTHDDYRRVASTRTALTGSDLFRQTYTWDDAGNKLTVDDEVTGVSRSLVHDSFDRLVYSVKFSGVLGQAPYIRDYELDGVHNRVSVQGNGVNGGVLVLGETYEMSDDAPPADFQMNQYTVSPKGEHSYDTNGNMTEIVDENGDLVAAFVYDFRNQLVRAENSDGEVVRFYYDPMGRRFRKRVHDQGTMYTTLYWHDGMRVLQERGSPGSTGTPQLEEHFATAYEASHVHGLGPDEILLTRRTTRASESSSPIIEDRYYLRDDLHSVMAITDESSVVLERYDYDDYGWPAVLAPDGSARASSEVENEFLFTGRRWDAETDLYYFRARYLDPRLGRFTTRDPLGIWEDEVNLGNGVAYAGSNPYSRMDPTGEMIGLPWLWSVNSAASDPMKQAAGEFLAEVDTAAGVAVDVVEAMPISPQQKFVVGSGIGVMQLGVETTVGLGVAALDPPGAAKQMAQSALEVYDDPEGFAVDVAVEVVKRAHNASQGPAHLGYELREIEVGLVGAAATPFVGPMMSGSVTTGRLVGRGLAPDAGHLVDDIVGGVGEATEQVAKTPSAGTFPDTADGMTEMLGVSPTKVGTTPDGTPRTTWEPNSDTRIRHESHPHGLQPGDPGFNPRHHGEHFHVETKPSGLSWGQAKRQGRVVKQEPDGYTPGSGTGFLPGEELPGS